MTETKVTYDEPQVVRLRGAAGAVHEFELMRLIDSEVYVEQLAKGLLRPADSTTAVLLAHAGLKVGP